MDSNGVVCLTLHPEDGIIIGDNIAIKVRKKNGAIRLIVSAPKSIRIQRVHAERNKVQKQSNKDFR